MRMQLCMRPRASSCGMLLPNAAREAGGAQCNNAPAAGGRPPGAARTHRWRRLRQHGRGAAGCVWRGARMARGGVCMHAWGCARPPVHARMRACAAARQHALASCSHAGPSPPCTHLWGGSSRRRASSQHLGWGRAACGGGTRSAGVVGVGWGWVDLNARAHNCPARPALGAASPAAAHPICCCCRCCGCAIGHRGGSPRRRRATAGTAAGGFRRRRS